MRNALCGHGHFCALWAAAVSFLSEAAAFHTRLFIDKRTLEHDREIMSCYGRILYMHQRSKTGSWQGMLFYPFTLHVHTYTCPVSDAGRRALFVLANTACGHVAPFPKRALQPRSHDSLTPQKLGRAPSGFDNIPKFLSSPPCHVFLLCVQLYCTSLGDG